MDRVVGATLPQGTRCACVPAGVPSWHECLRCWSDDNPVSGTSTGPPADDVGCSGRSRTPPCGTSPVGDTSPGRALSPNGSRLVVARILPRSSPTNVLSERPLAVTKVAQEVIVGGCNCGPCYCDPDYPRVEVLALKVEAPLKVAEVGATASR